ncbi:hypothetical protein DFH06DRAFT_1430524 [Mycena polygramma]|nr:hypothetical protein DFH06DRAFT_1430524 [Mycena polygramma]
MSFSLEHNLFSRLLLGLLVPGVTLTTGLLILYAYVAWNPVSRRYLDRVSFRLLVYALLGNLVFAVTLALSTLWEFPHWRCSLIAFGVNLSLEFTAGMFFCMAINLPLVLAYKVNGQKMEKWYIFGTVFVSLICNVVPYASGGLGWASTQNCWYRSPDPAALSWLIGTQTTWTLFTCVGEVVAFLILVGYLVAYELETWRFPPDDSRFIETRTSEASYGPGSTIRLYPFVSCLLNVTAAVLDLRVMSQENPSMALSVADFAIPASRPLIYGLLAATDPASPRTLIRRDIQSFLRALRARRYPGLESETQASRTHLNAQWADPCLTTIIDMEPDEFTSDAGGLREKAAREQAQTDSGQSRTSIADEAASRTAQITTTTTTAAHHCRPSATRDVVCQI